jgi:hypothetical protein
MATVTVPEAVITSVMRLAVNRLVIIVLKITRTLTEECKLTTYFKFKL